MHNDLKIIKKKYGEKFMHLCRSSFPTIIDNSPGQLSKILLDNFHPNRSLHEDLIENNCLNEFTNYIYYLYHNLVTINETKTKNIDKDPVSLMRQAGYTLYECKTDEDIQTFRKYYTFDEALCTFTGHRLDYCYVYFAVKDCADKLKRSDFKNPNRQDEYGTSVISIQFAKNKLHTLSIKNRYNHTVSNPDATFSNNLDNIIPGLTDSFAAYYGMTQQQKNTHDFELPGYVKANDGKYYKYNFEINNKYFCPNNIIIDNFEVTKYPRELYLLMDYFLLDIVNKEIISWPLEEKNTDPYDSFPKSIDMSKIKKITIRNIPEGKQVIFTPKVGEDIIVVLDKNQCIISYTNNNVLHINSYFLRNNKTLETITLNRVIQIEDYFLGSSTQLKHLNLPQVEIIGDNFNTHCDCKLTEIYLPHVLMIGTHFMTNAFDVKKVVMPNVLEIGNCFCCFNNIITSVEMPKVINIGYNFLECNLYLKSISLPNVITLGLNFCGDNHGINKINLPKVKYIDAYFLYYNNELTSLDLPNVLEIGSKVLRWNNRITHINLPKVTMIGDDILPKTTSVKYFYAPKLSHKLLNENLNLAISTSTPIKRTLKKSQGINNKHYLRKIQITEKNIYK